ncbi:hypothetical protein TRFO_12229 [Tritrichomonas foetus]|uniref:Protein kinase domain-containing protein n=1 Tax=Tritrichomonas foetus TaxID=1144522 RepID=A0A1J4J3X4_9EUKA|nr:hypothetical protein TRFO_12229 [Tritrichomonas foetus]|eukprot:OHS92863.1 hypothetical protein TRFO_12229 [Tritrichomonas foetus]
MGNQLTCPSGNTWYIDDFNALSLKDPVSIFDGTFNQSFRAVNKNQQLIAVKAIQLFDKTAISIAQTYYQIFSDRCTLSKETTSGNIISVPYLTRNGAYLMRQYIDMPLLERVGLDPPLEPCEKEWIAFQLLRAVINLHNIDLYHGDIKPENILVTPGLFVYLTDHAPYKPQIIAPNQPHYFIHFFSYGRRDAFMAPERISNDVSHNPNMFAADLFSLGCLLFYLFSDGESLFDFTSLVQYSENKSLDDMKVFDKIPNEDMKKLIISLIDIDPTNRINSIQTAHLYFPEWMTIYYDFFAINSHEKKIESILANTSTLSNVLSNNVHEGILIYLTFIAELFSHQISVNELCLLINQYGFYSEGIHDTRIKIVRLIPPLLFLLRRQSNIISSLALDTIIKMIKTIDVVDDTEPMHSFSSIYFVPRLLEAVKLKDTQNVIISRIPIILVEFSRLWPSILDELPMQPAFFTPMLPTSVLNKKVDETQMFIAKNFLSTAKSVAYTKSYSIFRALCFIVFQILNCNSYIPRIIEFLVAFLRVLRHCDKIRFYSEFYDPIQRALLSYVVEDAEDISIIFDAFTMMIQDGAIKNCHYSAIAKLVYSHLTSRSLSARVSAKILLKNIPQIYSNYSILALINPQNNLVDPNNNNSNYQNDSNGVINNHMNNQLNNQSINQVNNTGSNLGPMKKSNSLHSMTVSSPEVRTKFYTSCKFNSFDKILLLPNHNKGMSCILKGIDNTVSRYELNLQNKPQLKNDCSLSFDHKLVNIDQAGNNDSILITLDNEIILRRKTATIKLIRTKAKLTQSAVFNHDSLLVEINGELIDFNPYHKYNKKASYKVLDESGISKIVRWKSEDLFACSLKNGGFYIFDHRISAPITYMKFNDILDIVTLPNCTFGIAKKNEVSLFHMNNIQTPIFNIYGSVNSIMTVENSIVVLNQYGTYKINNQGQSYSLFDNNQFNLLHPNKSGTVPSIDLPQVFSSSLHGHTFPITSCTSYNKGPYCMSGDQAGYLNIWSLSPK